MVIKSLSPEESYDLLEIVEATCNQNSIIFCTQFETQEGYSRININPENDSPISEKIMLLTF